MNTTNRLPGFCETSVLEVVITEDGSFTPQHSSLAEDVGLEGGARLYLAEGLDESVTHLLATSPFPIPPTFLEVHTKNGTSPAETTEHPSGHFTVKWRTPVTQTRSQWTVEQRIQSGRPYDVDTFRDPQDLRLNHTRYERRPAFLCRPYHPLSISDEGEKLSQATLECVSTCFGHADGTLIGEHLCPTAFQCCNSAFPSGCLSGTWVPWLLKLTSLIFSHRALRPSPFSQRNREEVRVLV